MLFGIAFGFLPGMFSGVAAVNFYQESRIVAFGICLSIFLLNVYIVIKKMIIPQKKFTCPECNTHLPNQCYDEDDNMYYHCPECDIDWDVGLKKPDSSDFD